MKKPTESMDDEEYLRDLAERLRHIPVMYGTDDYDIGRLLQIARDNFGAPEPERN